MNCKQAAELITGYVDCELDSSECDALEAHLLGCPRCRDRVVREREVKELVRRTHVPSCVPEQLMGQILLKCGMRNDECGMKKPFITPHSSLPSVRVYPPIRPRG